MLGMAPLAAPIAAQQIANPVAVGTSLGLGSTLANGVDPWVKWKESPVAKAARIASRAANGRRYIKRQRELDADIACLKSVSACAKNRMQIERDLQSEREERTAQRAMDALMRQFGLKDCAMPMPHYTLLSMFGEDDE